MSEAVPVVRPRFGVLAAGILIIILGIAVGVLRLVEYLTPSVGTSRGILLQVPADSFPGGYTIWIVNSSMVVGVALVLTGAVLISGWVGRRIGVHAASKPSMLAVKITRGEP